MRHLKRTAKLGRQFEHRNAMLANMVCSLIKHKRITTTLAKAKAARSVAEKIVTLGKKGTLQARRLVNARLHTHGPTVQLTKAEKQKWRAEEDVLRICLKTSRLRSKAARVVTPASSSWNNALATPPSSKAILRVAMGGRSLTSLFYLLTSNRGFRRS
jgi:ribosomal protein L17